MGECERRAGGEEDHRKRNRDAEAERLFLGAGTECKVIARSLLEPRRLAVFLEEIP